MSQQRLRVPADLSAAAVGVLLAGAAPANVAYAVLLMATLVRLGTYRKHLHLSVLTELPRVVLAAAFPLGLLAPASPWAASWRMPCCARSVAGTLPPGPGRHHRDG